jgi:hypothetical protein
VVTTCIAFAVPGQCNGYFVKRKENADALAKLAIDNFIEMRDKTSVAFTHPSSLIPSPSLACIPYTASSRRSFSEDGNGPPRATSGTHHLRQLNRIDDVDLSVVNVAVSLHEMSTVRHRTSDYDYVAFLVNFFEPAISLAG